MTMFTETFTLERHLEELRAELRATIDPQEASDIRAELEKLWSQSVISQPNVSANDRRPERNRAGAVAAAPGFSSRVVMVIG
jgi:hypothetical protein